MKKSKRAALVTGGAVRLGRCMALHLAASGWDIALHYHSSQKEAIAVQKQIVALGCNCEIFSSDLSQKQDFIIFFDMVFRTLPNLCLLVNSASLYNESSFQNTSWEMWEKHFSVNLRAPFFLTQAFCHSLKKRKALPSSSNSLEYQSFLIVNIIDNKITFPQHQYASYVLSKKALADLSVMAAIEYAPSIRVNAIAPGVILPAETRKERKGYLDWRIDGIPLQRRGEERHLLLALDYLIENDFVTGEVLYIDGGESSSFAGRSYSSYAELESH